MTKPRIAVAGIHIESSTFTPYISTADDFIVTRGEELMDRFYWRDEDWPPRSNGSPSCTRAPCPAASSSAAPTTPGRLRSSRASPPPAPSTASSSTSTAP